MSLCRRMTTWVLLQIRDNSLHIQKHNFSLVARYSLEFTCHSLLVRVHSLLFTCSKIARYSLQNSFVTCCKFTRYSLLVAEIARCQKLLVTCGKIHLFTRSRSCSLQKIIRYSLQTCLLLVTEVACCRKSLVTRCKIYSLLVEVALCTKLFI